MAIVYQDASATISTTEYFLASSSTTQTAQTAKAMLQAWIDPMAMQAGDDFTVRGYEKVNAGTQRKMFPDIRLMGPQANLLVIPTMIVGDGWEFSIQKNSTGADRTFAWSLRKATTS